MFLYESMKAYQTELIPGLNVIKRVHSQTQNKTQWLAACGHVALYFETETDLSLLVMHLHIVDFLKSNGINKKFR